MSAMTDMLQISDLAPVTDAPDVLVFPDDERWDEARMAWNLTVDQRPAAVALPQTAGDVARVVRWARSQGHRVSAQGTGHNAMPLPELANVVLVKTHLMRQVSIDAEARVARAQAGAQWGDVVRAAAPHGLAALAGSSHDVGVIGYTLGGGMSFLARRYGMATNRVLAIELVTAEGEQIRADRNTHADLFWAMRGGGGSFGVVTAMEFELFDLPTVYAGAMFFPLERAGEVLHAWREWTATVPESITSVGRILRFPPLPDLPPHLSGQSFALVEMVCTDGEAVGEKYAAQIRALGPAMDTVATIPTHELINLHMDPPGPVPGSGDGQLLASLPAEAIDAAVAEAGKPDSTLLSFEIRHIGGEVARGRPGNGALAAIDSPYLMFAVGITPTPEAKVAVERDVQAIKGVLAPYDAGRRYLNFAEHTGTNPATFYDEDAYARLRIVKRKVDPQEVFLANHPIRPA
jgi:FAD/FMN-containing dehydrogenase